MGFLWTTGKGLQWIITVLCLMAFLLFGYDQGVFGGILENANWKAQFNNPVDTHVGIIVSSYNLGCLAGCFVNFFVAEHLGRRRTIWTAMCLVIIGAALQASAFQEAQLIIGRVVCGMGTGMKTSTVPMYQSELCKRERRGRLVSAEVLFVGVGIVFAYWFDFGMSYAPGPIAWRLPIAFQILFAISVIIIVFGVPESPRWLCRHGRAEEARTVLACVYAIPETDPFVESEMQAIHSALEIEDREEKSQSALSVFQKDEVRTRHRIFLAWLAQFMNQVGGINLVVYYSPTVLVMNVGMDPKTAQIIGGCINMMFMFGSILPTLTLDRMGRRKTMMWGSTGLGISMLLISALLSQGNTQPAGKSFSAASVAFFFTYMLIFGATVNCVPWVYVPEILPLKARTRGTAIGISSNWLWNFVIVMITPIIINRLGWKAYLIFMCTNLAFVPLVYFLFPETSNVGLEDVDHFFIGGENPVAVARAVQREIRAGRYERGDAGAVRMSVSGASGIPLEKKFGDTHIETVSNEI